MDLYTFGISMIWIFEYLSFHELGHALAAVYDNTFKGFSFGPFGPETNISKIHPHASRYLWGMGVNLITAPILMALIPSLPFWAYIILVLAGGSYDLLIYLLLIFKIGEIVDNKTIRVKIKFPWDKETLRVGMEEVGEKHG